MGIFNVSFGRFERRFTGVLKGLQDLSPFSDFQGPEVPIVIRALLDAHQSLLYDVFEHVEDCQKIAQIFFENDAIANKSAEYRKFRSAMREFRDPLALRVNRMKHNQARLGIFLADNSVIRIPGYSVQNVVRPGTIGPDPIIYKNIKRGDIAATSFGRDLRWLFCILFVTARLLHDFIDAIVKRRKVLRESVEANKPCHWTFDTAMQIEDLAAFVYPSERNPPIPRVTTSTLDTTRTMNIELLRAGKALSFDKAPGGSGFRLTVQQEGDGVSRSFQVP
ncbi:MAG: hypothetical protein ACREFD_15405 [Stellaceae bacterium]